MHVEKHHPEGKHTTGTLHTEYSEKETPPTKQYTKEDTDSSSCQVTACFCGGACIMIERRAGALLKARATMMMIELNLATQPSRLMPSLLLVLFLVVTIMHAYNNPVFKEKLERI